MGLCDAGKAIHHDRFDFRNVMGETVKIYCVSYRPIFRSVDPCCEMIPSPHGQILEHLDELVGIRVLILNLMVTETGGDEYLVIKTLSENTRGI